MKTKLNHTTHHRDGFIVWIFLLEPNSEVRPATITKLEKMQLQSTNNRHTSQTQLRMKITCFKNDFFMKKIL